MVLERGVETSFHMPTHDSTARELTLADYLMYICGWPADSEAREFRDDAQILADTQPRPNSSRHKHGQHRYRTFCGMSSLLQHGFAATARPVSSSKPESHENTTRTTNLAKCGSEAIPRNMSIRRTLRLFFFKTSWRSRPPWAGTLSQISSLGEHQACCSDAHGFQTRYAPALLATEMLEMALLHGYTSGPALVSTTWRCSALHGSS
jgi:hypothetical protein